MAKKKSGGMAQLATVWLTSPSFPQKKGAFVHTAYWDPSLIYEVLCIVPGCLV